MVFLGAQDARSTTTPGSSDALPLTGGVRPSLGEAANRYVSFQMVMGVIGLILFLVVFFAVIFPNIQGRPRFGPTLELPIGGNR